MDEILLDDHEGKFYTLVDGQECVLNFRPHDLKTWDFYRTFVPPTVRNRGIAAKLTHFALGYAQKHNKLVKPSCSYVRSYIEDHPEWSIIVAR